ncbi:MAG: homocysteine S-methyltransferase family protein [Bacteroidetes bacterium]|nr:homocysteine S-methyltransferase family protein [Bacteroidota bacterium]
MNREGIVQRLAEPNVVILDGPMGTELVSRGLLSNTHLWVSDTLTTHPEMVRELHEEYIESGAEIITTNTFRTNTRAFKNAGINDRSEELTLKAIEIAKEAIEDHKSDKKIFVAGSISPVEDCYRPDLVPGRRELNKEHKLMMEYMIKGGVDFVLLETMCSLREAQVVMKIANRVSMPALASFVGSKDGKLLSGESFSAIKEFVEDYKPIGIMVNCTPWNIIGEPIDYLCENLNVPIGVSANIGYDDSTKGRNNEKFIQPDEYAKWAIKWREMGVKIIGSCCGTNPDYTKALKEKIS